MTENKQLYENSGLQQVFEERGLPPREEFFTANRDYIKDEPNLAILSEQPWHRLALYMKVKGASNRAIAKYTDKSEAWISQLMRQPWARERMAEIANEEGIDNVQAVLKGALIDSVYKLIELRDDEDVPAAVKRGCCTDLIQQYLGKPRQQVEHSVGDGMEHLSDEELRAIALGTDTKVE